MNNLWLLQQDVLNAMRAASIPTAAQQAEYAESVEASNADTPRILTVAGDQAQINVEGVLTQRPSWIAEFFGGGNTTYPEIIAAIAVADADPNVKGTRLAIDSGGGQVAGMFKTMAAIKASKKPIHTVVSNRAASAAFGLASQTDSITADSRATQVGSIGVVAEFHTSEDTITIASSNAPKKRPDVKTEEGQAAVREELDALEALFIDEIAAGRKTSSKAVKADFGQGAVLLAEEAKKQGMIDAIAGSEPKPKASRGAQIMTLEELKAAHPDVYKAAAQIGADKERDRVEAHLIRSEGTTAMTTAIAAIKDGSEMTEKLKAIYAVAKRNDAEQADAAADDRETGDAADAASKGRKSEGDQGDLTFAALKNINGGEGVI